MTIGANPHGAPDRVAIRRALISVTDKSGLPELAAALIRHGIEIVSTGGTAKALASAGVPVRDVSELTGFPEILDGRVKTLHPGVHGGLLAIRQDERHMSALEQHRIGTIDLLIVNLYAFEDVLKSGADDATQVENIDIGGPAMIRAAAKNHGYVTVITDPADYEELLQELDGGEGALRFETRRKFAARAFARTASYDAAIARWFAERLGEDTPPRHVISGRLAVPLRYGENPHQSAAFYATDDTRPGAATAKVLQGKQLSYNNISDTDAAFELVSEFDPADSPAIAIIKHANPCGVAIGASLAEAYRKALACDPVSAFGGIVAANREIDAETARAMVEIFTEVIIAPAVTEEAAEIIAAKRNLRLLVTGELPDPAGSGFLCKSVAGGFLLQSRDNGRVTAEGLRIATRRAPTDAELSDMLFAFRVAKHVKSNAIVYAKGGATVGIGAGQMSRVDSSRIAAQKAADVANGGEPATRGSVVASDAFFPFADGMLAAIAAGATAVIQPGGSMRDEEVIAAADEHGVAMVFTGMRHFRH